MLQMVFLHLHSEDHRYWILNCLDSGLVAVICCCKIRLQNMKQIMLTISFF